MIEGDLSLQRGLEVWSQALSLFEEGVEEDVRKMLNFIGVNGKFVRLPIHKSD